MHSRNGISIVQGFVSFLGQPRRAWAFVREQDILHNSLLSQNMIEQVEQGGRFRPTFETPDHDVIH